MTSVATQTKAGTVTPSRAAAISFIQEVASMVKDGEVGPDGSRFFMEPEDAKETLENLIVTARLLVDPYGKGAQQ